MKTKAKFMLTHAISADPACEFAAEVRAGLTKIPQRELPSKYLYDEVGSALFEVISVLPEYGLTRADQRLLQRHAQEIVEQVPGPVAVAELGSGSAKRRAGFSRRCAGNSTHRIFRLKSRALRWPCVSVNWATSMP